MARRQRRCAPKKNGDWRRETLESRLAEKEAFSSGRMAHWSPRHIKLLFKRCASRAGTSPAAALIKGLYTKGPKASSEALPALCPCGPRSCSRPCGFSCSGFYSVPTPSSKTLQADAGCARPCAECSSSHNPCTFIPSKGWCSLLSHFTGAKVEAQRGQVAPPESEPGNVTWV